MGITLTDVDKAEAWSSGGILGPGRHKVKIVSATEGKSSGGHDQVELDFGALDGSGAILDWLVFTPNTVGKAKQLLDAVGIKAESGEWEFPTGALVDKQLCIYCADEPSMKDPSKLRTRVQAYEPLSAAAKGTGEQRDVKATPADDSDLPF